MVKAHHIYQKFEAATADDTTLAYTAVCEDLNEMTDADHKGTTAPATKELEPNNPEQVKAFKVATDNALIKFVNHIHSFNCYKNESVYEYYVHDYMDELLRTEQSYYKDASIEPILATIHDKYCKIRIPIENSHHPS